MLQEFTSDCGNYSLVFDDDGKVAYAYLKKGKKIVGDVWLYNRCKTPDSPEWKDKSKIPFANSKEYVLPESRINRQVLESNVNVNWEYEAEKPVAYVYVFEDLLGVIGVGDKPGYARFAAKDGPLAKAMQFEE